MAKLIKPKGFEIWDVEDPEAAGMSQKDVLKMWQYLVDTGMAWTGLLQGWYGRTATALIEQGLIKRKKNPYKETDMKKAIKDLIDKTKW